MKRKFTLLILLSTLFALQGFAQSSKMVMIEEATQASCPPCAFQNPSFDALLDANADKVVVLKYQTPWPGFDQMYLDNPEEVDSRIAYYNVQGVPAGYINGQAIANDCGYYPSAPACLSQFEINAANSTTAAFDLDINGTFEDGVLKVSGTLTANEAVNGNLKLRIALAEKTIGYDDAPGGTNGETEYHHVLKKFIIGGTSGIDLENSWAAGDSYTMEESIILNDITIYNYDELEIVAFVQNDNTRSIYQAAKDSDIAVASSFANNAIAFGLGQLPSLSTCVDEFTFSPAFTIQNAGSAPLTSADIVLKLNGNTESTYAWTGSLATLERDVITLPESTLTISPTDILSFTIENPNGMADGNPDDNTYEANFPFVQTNSNMLTLDLILDFFGNQTTWELRDPIGELLYNGGPYGLGGDTLSVEMPLSEEDGCYSFEIFDSSGNGICCSLGEGLYTLSDGNGTILAQGSEFGASESTQVFVDATFINVEETVFGTNFSVNPNPTSGNLTLDFSIEKRTDVNLSVHDMLGAKVMTIDLGTLTSGPHIQNIDMNNLVNGMYIVRLSADDSAVSKKVILTR